jgi:hypothetical protein
LDAEPRPFDSRGISGNFPKNPVSVRRTDHLRQSVASRRKPGNVAALLDLFPFRESESAGYRWLTDEGNGFALHLSERDR